MSEPKEPDVVPLDAPDVPYSLVPVPNSDPRDAEIAALQAQLVEKDEDLKHWIGSHKAINNYAGEQAARLSGLLKAAQAVDAAVASSHEPSDWFVALFVALAELHQALASCVPGGAEPYQGAVILDRVVSAFERLQQLDRDEFIRVLADVLAFVQLPVGGAEPKE